MRGKEGVRGHLRRGREHNEVLLVLAQHLLHRTCEPLDFHDALEVLERPVLHTSGWHIKSPQKKNVPGGVAEQPIPQKKGHSRQRCTHNHRPACRVSEMALLHTIPDPEALLNTITNAGI